jgi:hypothetical protein
MARGRTISERTARKLVEEALVVLGEDPRGVHVEPCAYDWAPEFYTFQAWARKGDESANVIEVDYLAVNPWTGDVWDAMACKRITSPAMQKEQDRIWQESRLAAEVRQTLRERSPACARNGPSSQDKPR